MIWQLDVESFLMLGLASLQLSASRHFLSTVSHRVHGAEDWATCSISLQVSGSFQLYGLFLQ